MKRLASLALTAVACLAGAAAAQDASMSFFVTSANPGQGADFGGIEGADAHCASLAEAAGVTGRTWRAYLSTGTDERPRPDRVRTLVQCGGRRDRRERRRAARRRERRQQGDRPRRDRRCRQRPRGRAEPARHPDRLAPGRHSRRADLRGLDQQRRRGGDGRTSRSHGLGRDPSVVVMELVASLPRLRSRSASRHRWGRPSLLLRSGLGPEPPPTGHAM